MKRRSNDILYSKGKSDENYTPDYAVIPLIEYLSKDKIVWCPFDKEDSEFVKILTRHGFKVVYSHIDLGQDFYVYEPNKWDVLVSNPPFSKKRLIFERALSFDKPFALLMTNTWLNDSAPKLLFMEKDLQLLMFDKRIRFYNRKDNGEKITFSSSYYCYNFLPKQIIMKELKTTARGNTLLTQSLPLRSRENLIEINRLHSASPLRNSPHSVQTQNIHNRNLLLSFG